MEQVKYGVLILENEPKYMVDMVNDDMLIFYDISKKSLDYYYNQTEKDLTVLSKDNVIEQVTTHKRTYNSGLLNRLTKRIPDKSTHISQRYKKPVFVSKVEYAHDITTGNFEPCFELKDKDQSHSGVFVSLRNITWLEETADLTKWNKLDNLIYLNGNI